VAERAGRPRDPAIDERVRAATRALLAEAGWERTSVRAVAERSGATRAAIHRRWPSKAHLVLDAILGPSPDLDRFAGVDRAGWVRAVVEGAFELFDRAEMRAAVPGLLATLRDHDDVRAELWHGFTAPATALYLASPPADGCAGARDERADEAGGDERADGAETDARAVVVLAAGAALVLTLLAVDDDGPAVRDRVARLLVDGVTPWRPSR
jgi:AcrR family transcriptional regulator